MQSLIQKCINEFLGTFLLVFVVLTTHNFIAIGAALSLAIFLFNGSFNSAVSLALLLNNEISSKEIVLFVVSELIGAIAAFYVSKIVSLGQKR